MVLGNLPRRSWLALPPLETWPDVGGVGGPLRINDVPLSLSLPSLASWAPGARAAVAGACLLCFVKPGCRLWARVPFGFALGPGTPRRPDKQAREHQAHAGDGVRGVGRGPPCRVTDAGGLTHPSARPLTRTFRPSPFRSLRTCALTALGSPTRPPRVSHAPPSVPRPPPKRPRDARHERGAEPWDGDANPAPTG